MTDFTPPYVPLDGPLALSKVTNIVNREVAAFLPTWAIDNLDRYAPLPDDDETRHVMETLYAAKDVLPADMPERSRKVFWTCIALCADAVVRNRWFAEGKEIAEGGNGRGRQILNVARRERGESDQGFGWPSPDPEPAARYGDPALIAPPPAPAPPPQPNPEPLPTDPNFDFAS